MLLGDYYYNSPPSLDMGIHIMHGLLCRGEIRTTKSCIDIDVQIDSELNIIAMLILM